MPILASGEFRAMILATDNFSFQRHVKLLVSVNISILHHGAMEYGGLKVIIF